MGTLAYRRSVTSRREDTVDARRAPRRLAEIAGSLVLAADVANGFPDEKVLRTALIATGLLRQVGARDDDIRVAYWVAVFRFFGCTSFAHEEGARYGAGDDVALRNTMALADVADPLGTVARVARGVAPGAPLVDRAVAVARLLGDGRSMREHAAAQCDASIRMAAACGLDVDVRAALGFICERWDGRGEPARAAGDAIPAATRALHVADVVEIAHHRGGRDAALAVARARRGTQLDPALVDALARDADARFATIEAADVWERFLAAEPTPHVVADDARLDDVVRAAGRFADLKTPWTQGHSDGVARLAAASAPAFGLRDDEARALVHAAHLHDLGRVGVVNRVWEKPGPLTRVERELAELHAHYTGRILARSPTWTDAATIASSAHERVDGAGYPRRVDGRALPRAARLLAAADAAHAMREDRPHRRALSVDAATRALRDDVAAGKLDRDAVDAVLAAWSGAPVRRRASSGLSDREREVLVLVARGKTNKEIATLLGISPKTVQHHVAHVYDKAGLHSRAGAALYVMENGLDDGA